MNPHNRDTSNTDSLSGLYTRPSWVQRLNRFGPAVGDAGLIAPLDADELLKAARASTGIHDAQFGDVSWMETFRRRVDSINTEAQPNLVGRVLARAEILRMLQTVLKLRALWATEPQILTAPVPKPIFVVGAPRTGTTILLELLALDPQMRAPIAFEAHHPLPLDPDADPDGDRAQRQRLAEAEQELWADIQPEMMTVHEMRSDLPCECVHFMAHDFAAGYWSMQYRSNEFSAWAATQDGLVARTYRWHRQFLQTLQHADALRREPPDGEPRQWLLKTPGHLLTMAELFAEYPDARIVHTHRDPLKFVASAASTTTILRWLRSDNVNPAEQGAIIHHGFRAMLEAVIDLRAANEVPQEQFFDSHYRNLMADPVAAIRAIYDHFHMHWPTGHADRISGYLRDKPKGKFGAHRYEFSDFGLDPETVRADYQRYVAHYGVQPET